MREKLNSHAGRLFLLAVGILLTSTAGHAAARMMALQMAQGSSLFAFELASTLAALLVAAYIVAVAGKRQPAVAAETGAAVDATVVHVPNAAASPALSAAQISQLRLPPGMRLDSHEAIMIATAGSGGRVVFVNQAFARLTGYDAREWMGRSADLLSADGALRMESLLWLDTAADGSEAHWIARLHRGDGAPFCAEAHIHPVAARTGGSAHIALVMTDVTSRVANKSREAAPMSASRTEATRKTA